MHLRRRDVVILLDTLTLSMCLMLVLCFLFFSQTQLLSTSACAGFRRALVSMRRPLHRSETAVASRFLATNKRTPHQSRSSFFTLRSQAVPPQQHLSPHTLQQHQQQHKLDVLRHLFHSRAADSTHHALFGWSYEALLLCRDDHSHA